MLRFAGSLGLFAQSLGRRRLFRFRSASAATCDEDRQRRDDDATEAEARPGFHVDSLSLTGLTISVR
jgi:hypothetical protein